MAPARKRTRIFSADEAREMVLNVPCREAAFTSGLQREREASPPRSPGGDSASDTLIIIIIIMSYSYTGHIWLIIFQWMGWASGVISIYVIRLTNYRLITWDYTYQRKAFGCGKMIYILFIEVFPGHSTWTMAGVSNLLAFQASLDPWMHECTSLQYSFYGREENFVKEKNIINQ